MIQKPLVNHALAAILVSYGLSVGFWAFLGVFNLAGFIIWSFVAAAIGCGLGYKITKHILGTVIFTAIIRIAIYVIMTTFVA